MEKILKNKLFSQLKININCGLLILVFISGITSEIFSQKINSDVICSSGETFVNSQFSFLFALGEIVVETYSASDYLLSQGFLQGSISSTGIDEKLVDPADIVVFPNPTNDVLYISCKTDEVPSRIELRNIYGKLILSVQYLSPSKMLNISQVQTGLYLLTFYFVNNQPIIKKIIKE